MPIVRDRVTIAFKDAQGNPQTMLAEGVFRGAVTDEYLNAHPLDVARNRLYSGFIETATPELDFLDGRFELDGKKWRIHRSTFQARLDGVTHYRFVYAELEVEE